jgi:SAM domain (Sterile alpha motif)
MQQIADWLEKLGMSEYAQRFAENGVNVAALRHLTDQDLEKIGVASLGHHRKLLRAIASLNDTPAVASPAQVALSAPQPIAVPSTPPPAEPVGERRHVTVMFCDLVDSTGIAARLDAEEWRDLVGTYLDAARRNRAIYWEGCSANHWGFLLAVQAPQTPLIRPFLSRHSHSGRSLV